MRIQLLVLATLLGSCVASAPVPYAQGQSSDLVGRVAGPPQRCVPIERGYVMRPASGDPNLLGYGMGKKIYVNRLSPGCSFTENLVLMPDSFGSSYCQNDVVRSVDASSRLPGPSCILNQWVPYTRAP
jgi:hypothetical protein